MLRYSSGMLVARSSPECHLYMDLHACSCGQIRFPASHTLRNGPNRGLLAVYQGTCPGCGLPRQFTFQLDDPTPPPPPAYGGSRPSRIIDPGEFMLVADQASGAAPLDPRGLGAPDMARGRALLGTAVAAVEEILKFIPPGRNEVPASAFTSRTGASVYAKEPGRFSGPRLVATLAEYRRRLAAYRAQ
jgi:hypothetical protein